MTGAKILVLLAAGLGAYSGAATEVERLGVTVHRTLPHDSSAFTQGLLWIDGKLYESTGIRGRSELRRVDPTTGKVEHRTPISKLHFGEGLASVADRLVMLTWHAGRAYVFARDDLSLTSTYTYKGEGWGLCHDGAKFVMSDGSSLLTFRDTASFERTGTVSVTLNGAPLNRLNELECVDGHVYANVFGVDAIVRIDPRNGQVDQWIDAGGLLTAEQAAASDVLNGIAFDARRQRFYLTGKLWPILVEATFD